jgi:hypothetical protein
MPREKTPGRLLLILLVIVVLLDAGRLGGEWRFFQGGSLFDTRGDAPVPQDDPLTPALDAALRAASLFLPRDAICVIAADSWQRTYFRASYLLQPRIVWPAVAGPAVAPVLADRLRGALRSHRATCLLVPAGWPVPSGWSLAAHGAVNLYLKRGT